MTRARIVRSYTNTVEARIMALRANPHTHVEHIGDVANGVVAYSCFRVVVGSQSSGKKPSVLLSGGVHGNEPAGVWALLRFLEMDVHQYLDTCTFVAYPCINPIGYEYNTRGTVRGFDLNRDFTLYPKSFENQIVLRSLHKDEKHFLFAMDLHESDMSEVTEDMVKEGLTVKDNPRGFYLYECAREATPRMGRSIIKALRREGIQIATQPEIFKDKNFGGVISYPTESGSPIYAEGVSFDTYLFDTCTDHAFTTETVTNWDAWKRVMAHRVAIQTVLELYRRHFSSV